ncbi:MAG: hypothetical protein ACKO2P_09635, partial [Planctomycetota bacterium]
NDAANQIAVSLLAPTSDDIERTLVHALSTLDSTLGSDPSASKWTSVHLLESPAVVHAARLLLLKSIVRRGIYRDLSDLQQVSGWAIACLLMINGPQAKRRRLLETTVQLWISGHLRTPNPADATLVGLMLKPSQVGILERLVIKDSSPAARHLIPLGQLAGWIHGVDSGPLPELQPSGRLWLDWLNTHAFRGMRRHWARMRGDEAGRRQTRRLDDWIRPAGEECPPPSLAAMLIEWTLAAARNGLDLRGMRHMDPQEYSERIGALASDCIAALTDEHASLVHQWLIPGMDRLLRYGHESPTASLEDVVTTSQLLKGRQQSVGTEENQR